jgi:hypothetical protein
MANIPNPTEWKNLQKPLFAVAKVRSLNSFHQECLACSIEQEEHFIYFTPTRNLGKKEGFSEILESRMSIQDEIESSEILNRIPASGIHSLVDE